MDINFVSRSEVDISKKNSSKYKPLLEAVKKIKAGGQAIEVSFDDEAELSSMRNAIYSYNRKTGDKVKSSKHPDKNIVYFFKEEEEEK